MKDLAKIELHLHLEGAAPPAFIRGLAAEKSIDLSRIFDENGSYKYADFDEFLAVYEAACTVLTGPEDFYRLTRAVLEQSAENGVVYSEAFLSPDFCGGGDLGAWREYLGAIQMAAAEAYAQGGIVLRGIVTCVRHFGPEQAKTVAQCAAETSGDFVRGFGMGGAEAVGTQSDYRWSFECAREAGLRLTSHAGEWGGPTSVRDAIEDLGVERIGHGVQSIEDPGLVDFLAERGTVLEVCPGSNIALGVFPDIASHPIKKLRDAGVKVTVSTDDPPFFQTTMTREFELLASGFGWDENDFAGLNQTALEAAFCDDETRAKVAKHLEMTQ